MMQLGPELKGVFFDIGNTLVKVTSVKPLEFEPFSSSVDLLRGMGQTLGLKIGIITNISDGITDADVIRLLKEADLLSFIEAGAIVTSDNAKARKPAPEIYQRAAERMGLSVQECLYVGDDLNEVLGAQKAGMAGILKPVPA